jgi:hypothetical protein
MEKEIDYWLLNIISRKGAKAQRRQKVLNKPAKKRIKKIIWRILQRTVSLDKLSFAASGRTGNAPFPLTNKGK